MSDNVQKTNNRPPRLRLPFEKRPTDIGVWSYDHRVGLCVTVIAYLVAAIVFVSTRIAVGGPEHQTGIYIDFQEEQPRPETPEEREERLKQEAEMDFSDIRNLVSNENAESDDNRLNEHLRDDRGTNAGEIYDEAEEVQRRIRANREAYEQGLSEEQAILNSRKTKTDQTQNRDVKIKGRVTVSFSLVNPIRTSVKLVVPAYRCEGGGEVIVNITVNKNGHVTAASVDRASSTTDNCMLSAALGAARESRFNVDRNAPEKQTGTISYIFIPQ